MSDSLSITEIQELMDSALKRVEFLSQLQELIQNPPRNPSTALIALNRFIGNPEFSKLFPKQKKSRNPVYKVPIESLNDGKSTSNSPPEFSSGEYVSYINSVGNSGEQKPNPNFTPFFKNLWESYKFNKGWMIITHEDIHCAIEGKNTRDHFGASFSNLRRIVDLEPKLLDFIIDCYNRMLDHEICPEWYSCGLVPAHKGGDTSIPKNFRPLTILPLFVRIWDSIISKKLGEVLKKCGIIDTIVQRGILSGVGGVNQNLLDVNLMLKTISGDNTAFFIDITNAYGSLNFKVLFHMLREYNFSPALTKYIETYYMNAHASYEKTIFRWENGLYQGSGLSNILFLIYIDYALKHAMRELKMRRIIDFGFDLQANTRAFVDDLFMILPTDSCGRAIEFIQTFLREVYGLGINQTKTYFYKTDPTAMELTFRDVKFKRVDMDFKYLGLRLMCFREEFLASFLETIRPWLEEIGGFDIKSEYKVYLYYRRVFDRINRTMKCYYAVNGKTAGFDEIMELIEGFIHKWTGVSHGTYLAKHIEYIANKVSGIELLESKVVDFRELFGIENPDDDFCEEMAKTEDPYCLTL
jgi:hypothetical protein